jgi:hypothetical protein
MSGRHCAVCDEMRLSFTIHEIHLSKHVQGLGSVVFPAKIKSEAVKIRVCFDCSANIRGILPNAIMEHHKDEVTE